MSNLMRIFLLYIHLIILSRISTFESHLIITADNVGEFMHKEYIGEIRYITGNKETATIEEDAFSKITFKLNQTGFFVRSFQISTLPEKLFESNTWFSQKLTELSLSDLKLRSLPEKIFYPLTEITILALNNNNLSSLHSNLFKYNLKLEIITIDTNNLKTLPAGLFLYNQKLQRVYLDGNKLVVISRGIFNESNLNHLYLVVRENLLICLPSVFMNLYSLNSWGNCLNRSSKLCEKLICATQRQNGCPPKSEKQTLCKDIDRPPVNGGWSQWRECSKTCASGETIRGRQCDSPTPKYGGLNCEEEEGKESSSCNEQKCPNKDSDRRWNIWVKILIGFFIFVAVSTVTGLGIFVFKKKLLNANNKSTVYGSISNRE